MFDEFYIFQIKSSSFGHLLKNLETPRLPEDSKGCLAVAGLRVCTLVGFCAQPQLLCGYDLKKQLSGAECC